MNGDIEVIIRGKTALGKLGLEKLGMPNETIIECPLLVAPGKPGQAAPKLDKLEGLNGIILTPQIKKDKTLGFVCREGQTYELLSGRGKFAVPICQGGVRLRINLQTTAVSAIDDNDERTAEELLAAF